MLFTYFHVCFLATAGQALTLRGHFLKQKLFKMRENTWCGIKDKVGCSLRTNAQTQVVEKALLKKCRIKGTIWSCRFLWFSHVRVNWCPVGSEPPSARRNPPLQTLRLIQKMYNIPQLLLHRKLSVFQIYNQISQSPGLPK